VVRVPFAMKRRVSCMRGCGVKGLLLWEATVALPLPSTVRHTAGAGFINPRVNPRGYSMVFVVRM